MFFVGVVCWTHLSAKWFLYQWGKVRKACKEIKTAVKSGCDKVLMKKELDYCSKRTLSQILATENHNELKIWAKLIESSKGKQSSPFWAYKRSRQRCSVHPIMMKDGSGVLRHRPKDVKYTFEFHRKEREADLCATKVTKKTFKKAKLRWWLQNHRNHVASNNCKVDCQ